MIALYDFVPKFCPNCGKPSGLDRKRNEFEVREGAPRADHDYKAGASCGCFGCELKYAQATTAALVTAATVSGSDLAQYV